MSGLREALEKLTYASDDGSEYEHNHQPWEGEPECPACWVEGIRQALAAHPVEPATVASREATWDPGDLWLIIHDQIDGAVDVGAAISDAVNEIVELVDIRPVRSEAEMKAEAIESFAAQVGAWPDDARVPVMVVKALAAERVADLRAGELS